MHRHVRTLSLLSSYLTRGRRLRERARTLRAERERDYSRASSSGPSVGRTPQSATHRSIFWANLTFFCWLSHQQRLYTKPWIPRVRVCGQRNHRVCVDAAHPSLRFAVAKYNCNQYTPQIDCWTIKHFEPNKLKNKKKKRILQLVLTFYQYRRASSQAGTINRHRVRESLMESILSGNKHFHWKRS